MKNILKKAALGIAGLTAVVSVGTLSSFAAKPDNSSCFNMRCNYTDSDDDGVCDNYSGSGTRNRENCIKFNADKSISGTRYIDSDGNGVCDNFSKSKKRENCINPNFGKKTSENKNKTAVQKRVRKSLCSHRCAK